MSIGKLTAAAIISLITVCAAGVINNSREVEGMTDKLIRIHVVANSDSESDQHLKLMVRDGILGEVYGLAGECKTKQEALSAISNGLDEITRRAEEVVLQSGAQLSVSCTLSREDFPQKSYDGFTLPAGEYDALCVRLGSAEGKNWWCVCYPSLCVGAFSKIDDCGVFTEGELKIVTQPEKVRYKLWCYEAVMKLKALFSKARA